MEITEEAQQLSQTVRAYIEERRDVKLADFDKKTASEEKKQPEAELEAYRQRCQQQRIELIASFLPEHWLENAAGRAKQIRLVTHGVKYLHSDAKGTSLFAPTQSLPEGLLATSNLASAAIDIVGNAAALDVGKLLQLGAEGHKLIDFIRRNDASPLQPFARDNAQCQQWLQQLREVVAIDEPSSHKLAKQIYWPVGDGYHLLCPLFASSFTQAIYERVQHSRFSDEVKAARDARKKQQYHPQPLVSFPELAVQNFGGSNQQNISQLNARRGGKAYLFSSAPPSWQSQIKAPLNITSVVDGPFVRQEYGRIKELREYLKRHLDSPSVKAIRAGRQRRIEAIVDQFIAFPARYMNVKPGWSQSPECKLPLHQQLWLDPGRCQIDEAFAFEHDKKNWQAQVADDFALMLNRLLKLGDQLNVGQPEYAQWKVEVAQELRLAKQEVGDIL